MWLIAAHGYAIQSKQWLESNFLFDLLYVTRTSSPAAKYTKVQSKTLSHQFDKSNRTQLTNHHIPRFIICGPQQLEMNGIVLGETNPRVSSPTVAVGFKGW